MTVAQFGVRRGLAARQLEDVAGAQLAQARLHLRDTLEHEGVEPVAGRGVGAGEALEADQRQVHAVGHLRRVQQGVIGCPRGDSSGTSTGRTAALPDGLVVERSHAFVHRGQGHGIGFRFATSSYNKTTDEGLEPRKIICGAT